jgi:hypothetical protein
MAKKGQNNQNSELTTDEEIRNLVIARLSVLSSDTMKSIGDEGTFSRDELIEHVKKGDKIGRTIEEMEMEWLRAMKTGELTKLFA